MRTAGILLLLVSVPTLILAQDRKLTSRQSYPVGKIGPLPESFPMNQRPAMIMVAPLVVETEQITSAITIVNNSELNAGVTISVRAETGAELAHSHLVLSRHEQAKLPVSVLMQSIPHKPELSSIVVTQDSTVKGMAVAAQLVITDTREATPSYIDEELEMPSIDGSNSVRAVTDDSEGKALIAVTNTEDLAQNISLRCLGRKVITSAASIPIEANATLFFNGCTNDAVTSFKNYSSTLQAPGEHRLDGMEISGDGRPGSLVGFAIAPHFRAEKSILSAVPFYDPALQRSPNFVFAGVPIGAQPTLPDGIYVPRISLANFSKEPAHITVSAVDSTEIDSARPEAGASSTPRKLRDLTIPAGCSLEVMLNSASSQGGLLHSIRVTSDRKPGEVMGKLVSRSDGNLYQIELLGKDELDRNNAGMHPWSTEGDAESHLLLFNHSASELTFDVAIYNAVGGWNRKYKLAAYETREISINQVALEKIKDDRGRLLDPNYRSGTVNWMVPDSGTATGRLMVTSHSNMMARNYSCGNFIVLCEFFINISNYDSGFIHTSFPGFSGDPQFCDEFSPSECTGGNDVGSGSATYSSAVSPSSIVRLNSSGDATSQYPNLYGVGGGAGSGTMYAEGGGCSGGGGPNPPPKVQVPTSTRVVQTLTNAAPTCPTHYTGWERYVARAVTDQNSPPQDIKQAGQELDESVSPVSGSNGLGVSVVIFSANTDASGQFIDDFGFAPQGA